ncbi:MAG: hypothetical protein LC808_23215 [Actinobacteria bacterium]|nr:hypothetical protein [Actinomycetota bacterium]
MVCEPAEVGSILRRMLEAIDAGELEATVTDRTRIEGAIVACEVLAGGDLSELVERLRGDLGH